MCLHIFRNKSPFYLSHVLIKILNTKPMGHIAHTRKHFISINILEQNDWYKSSLLKSCYLPWRARSFIWTYAKSLHPRMLFAKFGWNWLSGFGKADFLIFAISWLSPLEKERGPSFEQTWISFISECFVPCLVETDPPVLERRSILNHFSYFTIISPWFWARPLIWINLNPHHQIKDALRQV